jgi:predicted esterase
MQTFGDLQDFLSENGPFNALIGFSEGAAVAASLLVHEARRTYDFGNAPAWNCAIFFSAGYLTDPNDMLDSGVIRQMNAADDGTVIKIPTAHIWSEQDALVGFGEKLSKMCDNSTKEEFIHSLGHQVPGAKTEDGLSETLRAIERTVERALVEERIR